MIGKLEIIFNRESLMWECWMYHYRTSETKYLYGAGFTIRAAFDQAMKRMEKEGDS